MIVDRLEDTLNGGYKGLYGEVVEADCYRLRQLKFIPDIIFDVGANIGVFARFARELFPGALIVSVEPNFENRVHYTKFTKPHSRTVILNKALGMGPIYHGLTARNGSGETYLSAGLGYPKELMEKAVAEKQGLELAMAASVPLSSLIDRFWFPGAKCVLKV